MSIIVTLGALFKHSLSRHELPFKQEFDLNMINFRMMGGVTGTIYALPDALKPYRDSGWTAKNGERTSM